jgi:ATP-dependent RNA helicase RhlE
VPGFEPGAPVRRDHDRGGHGHKHEPRVGHGPKTRLDRLPAPAAHLPPVPRVPKQPMIAADGFDFSKPYEEKGQAGEAAPADKPAEKSAPAPRRPLRPVAALLGGFGKK